jgi:chemotaxis protein MotA
VFARAWTGLLAIIVFGAVSIQLLAPGSGVVAVIAGIWLVVGGTLLTTRLSHSESTLMALTYAVRTYWRDREAGCSEPVDPRWFLEAANHFRYGKIWPAEQCASRIEGPLLRRGTQMVLDGFPREQVTLALQRQIAEERDHFRQPVDLLRAMAGYSPTLGMLGTLLGMVQMLFGLGSGDLDRIGVSMGFAMLTTVYGLVLANLLLKPLASKLEQIGRLRTKQRAAEMQAVMMLYERSHAAVIRELMDDGHQEWTAPPKRSSLTLAASMQ